MSMFCEKCGTSVPDGTDVCPNCGAVLNYDNQETEQRKPRRKPIVSKNTQENIKNVVETAGRKVSNMVDIDDLSDENDDYDEPTVRPVQGATKVGGVVLAENEKVIRRYLCAYIRSGFFSTNENKGYLTITNQRVLFEGKDRRSRICMETPIDSVGSVFAYRGNNISVLKMIIGIAFALGGLGLLSSDIRGFMKVVIAFILLGIGAFICLKSFRKAYMLSIYSSANAGTAILVGEGPKSAIGNDAFYTLEAAPTEQTNRMMSEIGAVIHDVQMLGDGAIDKWSR